MLALALHISPADVWAMAPRDMATVIDVLAEQNRKR